MKKLNLALCEGRHPIPQAVDGSIFCGEIADVTATEALETIAFNALEEKTNVPLNSVELNIYVTGLTVALIAALNVCHTCGIKVTLWHYNRETGDYYPQEVK